MTRKKLMGVVAVTGLCLQLGSASAYIIPTEALLERAAKARARLGLRAVVVEGWHERAGVRSQVWEAIRPDARRRELKGPEEATVLLGRGRQRYEFVKGEPAGRPSRGPIDVLSEFAFPAEPESFDVKGLTLLQELRIDSNVITLGRQDRRIVYVIGAKANEPDKPQLWIDKELLVPVRLVRFDRSRARIETRWLGFDAPLTSPYFPRRIETWVDGEMTEAVTYDSIEINPKLDASVFTPTS